MKEDKKSAKQRNHYVDFIRGIAIICIVLIHTAWHSGTQYVPTLVRNMTLLFETPIFFFIAGWTFSYVKSNKKYISGLIKLQYRYMIYMTIVFIILVISTHGKYVIGDLINWFFHNYTDTYPLRSVAYSLWFMRTYFVSVVFGIVLITYLSYNGLKKVCGILWIMIIIQTFSSNIFNTISIGLNVTLNYVVFYTFIYLLGYMLKDYKMNNLQFAIIIAVNIIALLIFKYLLGYDILDIQANKQNTNMIYLLWSMFGITLVIFLKRYMLNMRENMICQLGKRTIYLYFAQGISSSLLYFILPYVQLKWPIKLTILFLINLVIAILIMWILEITIENAINLPKYALKWKGIKNAENKELS